jgi:SAM-dependent methyltransferase
LTIIEKHLEKLVSTSNSAILVKGYRLISPLIEPRFLWRGIMGYPRYLLDMFRYRRLVKAAGSNASFELYPCLHDWTSQTGFDPHYTYLSYWATKQLEGLEGSQVHVDVGSQISWVVGIAAKRPVVFIDIRPFDSHLPDLEVRKGSILDLPFADQSVESLSCLHVAEHIGLGRYGDPLEVHGTKLAAEELSRALAPGGRLLFALPVGIERICFNAHRVHSPTTIINYFAQAGLELAGFAAVDDKRAFHMSAKPEEYSAAEYACGMFVFRRPS